MENCYCFSNKHEHTYECTVESGLSEIQGAAEIRSDNPNFGKALIEINRYSRLKQKISESK